VAAADGSEEGAAIDAAKPAESAPAEMRCDFDEDQEGPRHAER
jgi:hypothetical protein